MLIEIRGEAKLLKTIETVRQALDKPYYLFIDMFRQRGCDKMDYRQHESRMRENDAQMGVY